MNLVLAAVAAAFLLQIAVDTIYHSTCRNMGVDYCAYWSAGKIANTHNYAAIYDLDLLDQLQRSIYPASGNVTLPIPFPYLPVLVFPFQLLALLTPEASFWVWMLTNLGGFIFYLRFFTRSLNGRPLPPRLLFMLILSIPVFLNLYLGQLNILLGICVGEFLRSFLADKSMRSGLWLGGLLIKPQTLLIILPVLLLRKQYKAIAGFLFSFTIIIVASYVMIGTRGIQLLSQILVGSAQGTNISNPEIMMNWRMLGTYTSRYLSPELGWGVIILGSLITAFIAIIIGQKLSRKNAYLSEVACLGIFAATGAAAWHAHFSMSIILIPPLVLLVTQKRLPNNLFSLWLFLPIILTFLANAIAILMQTGVLPGGTLIWLNLQTGLRGFFLNLLFLFWSFNILNQTKTVQNNIDL